MPKWWRKLWDMPVETNTTRTAVDADKPDLREFVYLDEVSLRSLLSSQKGGVTDSTLEEASNVHEAALTGTLGVSSPLIAKADLESRYQTSNSSTIQTSRKATVQSWFRELHEIEGLRLIEPVTPSKPADDLSALEGVEEFSLRTKTEHLRRGRLVEYRVRLAADPVFHLGTMVSEFTGMAEDYPEMFAEGRGSASLKEVQPINKILQRLLAGLIPIRAESVDYLVVVLEGVEYVVHRELIKGLNLTTKPLEIVGVTEHLAYWKDIRRVLFSDSEFTMLCRISKQGLQDSWTPVKLADLFSAITPDLVEQINAAGKTPFGSSGHGRTENGNEMRLGEALRIYADAILEDCGERLSEEQSVMIALRIEQLKSDAGTVSGQRAAFGALTEELWQLIRHRPEAARAMVLRDEARQRVGLSLFPALTSTPAAAVSAQTSDDRMDAPRILDVEVIAIYW